MALLTAVVLGIMRWCNTVAVTKIVRTLIVAVVRIAACIVCGSVVRYDGSDDGDDGRR